MEQFEAQLKKKKGARIDGLPLGRDGKNPSREATAAGTGDRASDAPNLERVSVPAETARRRDGEFLANVSHGFLTSLHGIMGMTEALSVTALSLEQRTSVQLLRTSAGSLLDAVDNLLDFSLLNAGQVELICDSFDLEELLADLRFDRLGPGRR